MEEKQPMNSVQPKKDSSTWMERPYSGWFTMQEIDSLGNFPMAVYHWRKLNDIMASNALADEARIYSIAQEKFVELCEKWALPYHNAIAFWECLMNNEELQKNEPQEFYILIFCACYNFGDFFKYSLVRNIPEDYVRPEDIIFPQGTINNSSGIFAAAEAHFKAEVDRLFLTSSDRKYTCHGSQFFENTWNDFLASAQEYRKWRDSYANGQYKRLESFHHNEDRNKQLSKVFAQYIHILGETRNAWHEEFALSEEGPIAETIYDTFGYLVHLIESQSCVRRIAPAYVTLLFQKYTKKIYTPCKEDGLGFFPYIPLSVMEQRPKLRFSTGALSNIKGPQTAATIIYRLLCTYFQEEWTVDFNSSLCDYIFERTRSIIDQPDYSVTIEQVSNICSGKKVYSTSDFLKSETWTHPLVQSISGRLRFSLNIYINQIPTVVENVGIGARRDLMYLMDRVEAAIDPEIISQYKQIMIDEKTGLGCVRMPIEAKFELAELLDKIFLNALPQGMRIQMEETSEIQILLSAAETKVHTICCSEIHEAVYRNVMEFVYNYLYSVEFGEQYSIGRMLKEQL